MSDAPTPEAIAKRLWDNEFETKEEWFAEAIKDINAFAAAEVGRERERCFRWAIRFVPRKEAGRAIRDGDPIG